MLARQVAARISRLVPHSNVLFTTCLEHDVGIANKPSELIDGLTVDNMLSKEQLSDRMNLCGGLNPASRIFVFIQLHTQ